MGREGWASLSRFCMVTGTITMHCYKHGLIIVESNRKNPRPCLSILINVLWQPYIVRVMLCHRQHHFSPHRSRRLSTIDVTEPHRSGDW
jgi:hypothetical protein